MIRIDPPLPLDSPRGPCWAHFLIDYGSEHHLLFVCFLAASGECWTFKSTEIRLQPNPTLGIRATTEVTT